MFINTNHLSHQFQHFFLQCFLLARCHQSHTMGEARRNRQLAIAEWLGGQIAAWSSILCRSYQSCHLLDSSSSHSTTTSSTRPAATTTGRRFVVNVIFFVSLSIACISKCRPCSCCYYYYYYYYCRPCCCSGKSTHQGSTCVRARHSVQRLLGVVQFAHLGSQLPLLWSHGLWQVLAQSHQIATVRHCRASARL
jgi:hypothetical protein